MTIEVGDFARARGRRPIIEPLRNCRNEDRIQKRRADDDIMARKTTTVDYLWGKNIGEGAFARVVHAKRKIQEGAGVEAVRSEGAAREPGIKEGDHRTRVSQSFSFKLH